MTQSDQLSKV